MSQARIWNGTIYYTPSSGLADDIAVTAVSAPVDSVACEFLSTTETVTATFTNFGSNTVLSGSLVQLDLTVDGTFVTSEFVLLPNDLMLGQSYTHTFPATADCSAPGPHTVDVTVVYAGDLDPSNDTKSIVVNSGSPTTVDELPLVRELRDRAAARNGTTPPIGWTQDQTDGTGTNSDWYFHDRHDLVAQHRSERRPHHRWRLLRLHRGLGQLRPGQSGSRPASTWRPASTRP